jgi:hypothetical protein
VCPYAVRTAPAVQVAPLLSAVVNAPVSISVDASSWHFYEQGVFTGCNTTSIDVVSVCSADCMNVCRAHCRRSLSVALGRSRSLSLRGALCVCVALNAIVCGCCCQDHVVQLVGYGTDPQFGDYYIVRNSWCVMLWWRCRRFTK